MNILIDGSGSIGIALGASMISQGADVSFYASKKTKKAMENGIKRIGLFNHLSFSPDEFNVYTDYKDIPRNSIDYVFITSKTTSNDDISSKLNENREIFKDNGIILIFQNGFGNDEPYLRYFPSDKVFCARVITGFKRPKRNISEITVYTEPIELGTLQDGDINLLKPIAELITKSGIPCNVTDNVAKFLWAKMLYNCALNPLGAILGVNYGKLTENKYTINIMNQIIDEIFNVIKASGYSIDWDSPSEYKDLFYSKLVPDTYEHVSSTSQDIQKKIKTEIDSLNGKVIRLGEEYGIDVTVNKVLYNMIKAIESDF